MSGTLNNDIHDTLKVVENTLITVAQRLKDQDETITLLKQSLDNEKVSIIMHMRIKIKEHGSYDKTHKAKLLGNLFGTLSS
jgi:hypothetical protein